MVFKFKSVMVGFVFMSVAVIVFSQFYLEMGDAYGVPISDDFGKTYNILNNITSLTDQQQTAIGEGSVEEQSLFSSITNGVLVAMDFFLSFPVLMAAIASEFITSFDLPPPILAGITTVFVGMIILLILTLIMKVKPEV